MHEFKRRKEEEERSVRLPQKFSLTMIAMLKAYSKSKAMLVLQALQLLPKDPRDQGHSLLLPEQAQVRLRNLLIPKLVKRA